MRIENVKLALLVAVLAVGLVACKSKETKTDAALPSACSWVDNPGEVRDKLAAVGAAVNLGNIAAARDSAATNGRAQLAATLKAEINQLVEDWSKQAGNLKIKESLSSYINNENFTRQYVDTTIKGGRAVKYCSSGDTMYCLVILDTEGAKEWYDKMGDAIEQEALRDATLWKTEAMKSEARDRFDALQKQKKEESAKKIEALKGAVQGN
jgi:hypothetical protein